MSVGVGVSRSSDRTAGAAPRERWLVALTEYAGVTRYTGGIGTHYASLLPALVRLGIEVHLVLFSAQPLPRALTVEGVTVIAAHRLRGLPEWARLMLRPCLLRLHFGRLSYDRVLAPEWGGIASALPTGSPLVTNLATGIRLGDWIVGRERRDYPRRRRVEHLIQDRLEDRQITRSRGVVSISRAVLDWNRRNVPGLPPAVIVRNCVDIDAIREVITAPVSNTADSPVVLFVGRLERRKGILPTMRAFAAVLDACPGARLQLAGSSGDRRFEPSRSDLLALLPAPFRDRVEFLGHLAGEELFRRAAAATVVLCPSIWEGFGNAALEMKAVGVPLVVTNGSGFGEFCEDSRDCLMVPPDDATALAKAIVRITSSPELAAQLRAGARLSVENHTPDAVAPDLLAAVQSFGGVRRTRRIRSAPVR